jgi:signal transduction histidine kinase
MADKDKIAVFRIIRDYLLIVLKNPSSSRVTIEVTYPPPSITLALSQNDPGFNFIKAGHPVNINNINNRITYFNGKIRQKKKDQLETSVVELSLN